MSSTIVISASYDKQIRCWNATTGRTVCCFTFQDSQVNAIHLVYQTHYLAVAGYNVIRLYDLKDINCGNIVGSQVLQQQQQMVTTAPGGQTVIAPPSIFSSYETQGSINFTSLGSFPLLPRKRVVDERNLRFNDNVNVVDTSFSTYEYGTVAPFDFSPAAISLKSPERHLSSATNDTRVILYATGEDGHIRFFDAKTPNTMSVLRDITTGAAITCSCLSPDSRFLLTGNQIGQVSVWHLPTIITGIAREQQQQWCPTASADGGAFIEAASADTQEAAERAAVISKFGRRPVHEFALEGDYTSVRSISIDPLARWFVVATNQGKLHFFRFAHDGSLYGTKSAKTIQSLKPCVSGELVQEAVGPVPTAPYESGNPEGNSSSVPRLHSEAECSTNNRSPQAIPHGSSDHPTFPTNDLSTQLKSSFDQNVAIGHRSPRTVNLQGDPNLSIGDCRGGSIEMDATRLPQLELHYHGNHNRELYPSSSTPQNLANRNDKVNFTPQRRAPSPSSLLASLTVTSRLQLALQKEMETEEFHTFQAHYKYILKVIISPNGELLSTCCADYTVGRFIIPEIMRGRGKEIVGGTVQVSKSEKKSHTICPKQQADALKLNLSPTLQNEINDSANAKKAVKTVLDPPMQTGCASDAVQKSADNPNTSSKLSEGADVVYGDVHDAGEGVQSSQGQKHQVEDVNEVVTKDITSSSLLQNKDTKQEPPLLVKRSGTAIGNISSTDVNLPSADFCGGSELDVGKKSSDLKGENAISPNKQRNKHELKLYFKPLPPLTDHTRWVWDCVFSDCSQFLFSVSSDCHVRMWNNITSDRPQSTVFVGHTKSVIAVLLTYNLQ
ncbi:unnamed protein product [Phytomonas sp. Hart1]|nr:unnamed protein product [Phytomonas sp. Hart1]|eukprot:CCW71901.1 unnamed protein product [Phytomonas sp. isolate Hart1]